MVRLLLDEGLPLRTAAILRKKGMNVIHAREVGLASAADPVILEFARNEGRVCVTLDHDFHRLLADSGATQPSVIFIRVPKLTYLDAAELIARLEGQLRADLNSGSAVTATLRGVRMRRCRSSDLYPVKK